MARFRFTKKERIKSSALINQVFEKGLPYKGRFLNIYFLERDTKSEPNRVAFVVNRHLYNKKVVSKNRFKRILREAYRRTKHLLSPGFDIVISSARLKETTTSSDLEKELEDVFKKISNKHNKILS